MHWCQDFPRNPTSMLWGDRVALTPRGRPTQDQAGGFNVVADQYTCSLVTVCNEVNPITLVAYDEHLKGWND